MTSKADTLNLPPILVCLEKETLTLGAQGLQGVPWSADLPTDLKESKWQKWPDQEACRWSQEEDCGNYANELLMTPPSSPNL